MKNWKTTSAGITSIITGLTMIVYGVFQKNITPELITAAITALLTGVGLLYAKDFDKTGK